MLNYFILWAILSLISYYKLNKIQKKKTKSEWESWGHRCYGTDTKSTINTIVNPREDLLQVHNFTSVVQNPATTLTPCVYREMIFPCGYVFWVAATQKRKKKNREPAHFQCL